MPRVAETFEGTACRLGHTTRYKNGGGCATCMREYSARPEVAAERNRKRREAYQNDEAVRIDRRERNYREHYGIGFEEYDAMLEAQHYSCAICDRETWETGLLQVDHNHATGAIRALLCVGCNLALGSLQDSPDRARRAASYLERHL